AGMRVQQRRLLAQVQPSRLGRPWVAGVNGLEARVGIELEPICRRERKREPAGEIPSAVEGPQFQQVLWVNWRRGSESNRRIKVLQTSPLPLGYRASTAALKIYRAVIAFPRISNRADSGLSIAERQAKSAYPAFLTSGCSVSNPIG